MINFRFHLVSITAIFLALAAGIAVGAAVVNRASVDLLRTQLDEVEARRQETNARNDQLKERLEQWDRYAEQAGDHLVEGRLIGADLGAPVMIVAVDGIPRELVDQLEAAMAAAGASLQGTVWLSPKWSVQGEEAAGELAGALGIANNLTPGTIRRAGIARLGRALVDGDPTDLLVALEGAAFVEHAVGEGGPALASVPTPDAAIVVVSAAGAEIAGGLGLALVEAMATGGESFLVAQPGAPRSTDASESFVARVRSDAELASQVTTIDSLDDYRGRVAAVLAVEALGMGITGHYGLGLGAERILPELPAPSPAQ